MKVKIEFQENGELLDIKVLVRGEKEISTNELIGFQNSIISHAASHKLSHKEYVESTHFIGVDEGFELDV